MEFDNQIALSGKLREEGTDQGKKGRLFDIVPRRGVEIGSLSGELAKELLSMSSS